MDRQVIGLMKISTTVYFVNELVTFVGSLAQCSYTQTAVCIVNSFHGNISLGDQAGEGVMAIGKKVGVITRLLAIQSGLQEGVEVRGRFS